MDAQYTSLWSSKIAPRCAIGGSSSSGGDGPTGPAGPAGSVGPTGPAGGGSLSVETKTLLTSQSGPTGNTGTALSTSINTSLLTTSVTPLLNFNAVSEIVTPGSRSGGDYFNGVTSICNVPATDDYIFATDMYNSVGAPYSLTIGDPLGTPNRGIMFARISKDGTVAWRSANIPVGLNNDFSTDVYSQVACDTNFLVTLDTFKSFGFFQIYGSGVDPNPDFLPQLTVQNLEANQYNVVLSRRPIDGSLQPVTGDSNPLQTNWWAAKFIPNAGTDVYGNGVASIENNVCALITFGDGPINVFNKQNIPNDQTSTSISGLGASNRLASVVYYSTTGQYLRNAGVEFVDYDTSSPNNYNISKFYNRITSDEKNVYVMVNALGSSINQNIVLRNSDNSPYVTINTGDVIRKVVIAGLSDFGFYQWYYYMRETNGPVNVDGQSIVVKDGIVYVTFVFQGTVEIRTLNTTWATLSTTEGFSIGLVRISAKTGQFIDAKELVSCDSNHVLVSSNFSSITPVDGNRKYYMTCSITTTDLSTPIIFNGIDGTPITITPPYIGPSTYTIMYDSTGLIVGLNYTGGPNTSNQSVAVSNCLGVSNNNTVVVGGAYINDTGGAEPSAYISTFGTTDGSLASSIQTLNPTQFTDFGYYKYPLFTVYLVPTCLGTLGNPVSSNVTKTLIASQANGNVLEVDTVNNIRLNNDVYRTIILPKTGSTISLYWSGTGWFVLSLVDSTLQ
jgi:hypothetical protein